MLCSLALVVKQLYFYELFLSQIGLQTFQTYDNAKAFHKIMNKMLRYNVSIKPNITILLTKKTEKNFRREIYAKRTPNYHIQI